MNRVNRLTLLTFSLYALLAFSALVSIFVKWYTGLPLVAWAVLTLRLIDMESKQFIESISDKTCLEKIWR